ncbi:hypothetical protein BJ508DRAFT_308393 [Ascobolus immersus RN42]|uniref:Uncharacterized protein n=1 Tax=Ascobolus immersus RN42 TaxID=1160509 RepID=A0A3N4I201_ASCIM|nr:hypothetical protein BJ508DRAFT_308393 [Ascobolus immersus RN42]
MPLPPASKEAIQEPRLYPWIAPQCTTAYAMDITAKRACRTAAPILQKQFKEQEQVAKQLKRRAEKVQRKCVALGFCTKCRESAEWCGGRHDRVEGSVEERIQRKLVEYRRWMEVEKMDEVRKNREMKLGGEDGKTMVHVRSLTMQLLCVQKHQEREDELLEEMEGLLDELGKKNKTVSE